MSYFEDGPDFEPDDHEDVYVGTVRHACGHDEAHYNCAVDHLPTLAVSACSGCAPVEVEADPFGDAP